jgi:hypothetical protein
MDGRAFLDEKLRIWIEDYRTMYIGDDFTGKLRTIARHTLVYTVLISLIILQNCCCFLFTILFLFTNSTNTRLLYSNEQCIYRVGDLRIRCCIERMRYRTVTLYFTTPVSSYLSLSRQPHHISPSTSIKVHSDLTSSIASKYSRSFLFYERRSIPQKRHVIRLPESF